jgi:hypothetical protein
LSVLFHSIGGFATTVVSANNFLKLEGDDTGDEIVKFPERLATTYREAYDRSVASWSESSAPEFVYINNESVGRASASPMTHSPKGWCALWLLNFQIYPMPTMR